MKLSQRIVQTHRSPVFLGGSLWEDLSVFLKQFILRKYRLFILADENTARYCLPVLTEHIPSFRDSSIIIIPAGEDHKTLETAGAIWEHFAENRAGRDSLLVNLGGGVITDLGGFAAACHKRGIPYINIPTTMIGQADAAIGGKTGVNSAFAKNQIGLFRFPEAVFIHPRFLETLPPAHVRSGIAEIVKSALIGDPELWKILKTHSVDEISGSPFTGKFWSDLLKRAVTLKTSVVKRDPFEKGYRKILNFGHTIGHAVESVGLEKGQSVLHGEAVAAGMICELLISYRSAGLTLQDLRQISGWLYINFGNGLFVEDDIERIIEKTGHDKKNLEGIPLFSLISSPGQPLFNRHCDTGMIRDACRYYLHMPQLPES